MNLDEALESTAPPTIERTTPEAPKGTEAGAVDDGETITVTTGPRKEGEPTEAVWRELAADWSGLNPDDFEIVGPVTYKGWDSPVKGTKTKETIRLRSYTARLIRKQRVDRADVDRLRKAAARRKRPAKAVTDTADSSLVVCLSDWQLGKGKADGSGGTVDRITAASWGVLDRLRDLKRVGRTPASVYVVGLGDIVEQCDGHYAMQTFTADLTRREQMQVARRLILRLVDMLIDAGWPVVLSGIAGNHGENRRDGKAYTTFEDNDDLALLDQCRDVFASNPERYDGLVSVWIPEALSMALDVSGTIVGFAHGHQTGKGSTPAAKVSEWWKGQIVGRGPTADAAVLVTGHYHHLLVSESVGRTHLQCPAMDPGSRWWTERTGQSSPPGLLTFCAGTAYGERGWGDLAVI